MRLGFPKNLLILGNLKTNLLEVEDEESKSESLEKIVSSFFLEIA